MIILEWLTEYMTTPKMEMTTETEMLGLVAIGIIAFIIIGVCFGAWGIIDMIIKVRNKKHKGHRGGG